MLILIIVIFAILAGAFIIGIAITIAKEINFDTYIREHLNQNSDNKDIIMSEALTDDQINEMIEKDQ